MYLLLKQKGEEARDIMQIACISSGTLFNICQNLNEEIKNWGCRETNSTS